MERILTLARYAFLENFFHVDHRRALVVLMAVSLAVVIWHVPPPALLNETGMHFLATLSAAVTLWMFETFEEYVVALMLLLSWLVLNLVPPQVALAGFSKSSWFFALGAFGLAAAVAKSGLLRRVAFGILRRIPPLHYKIFTLMVSGCGFLATPLLPSSKARAAIIVPVGQMLSEVIGFNRRSPGSARLALSAYVGFGQVSFMFLTGATYCLMVWNLMPESAKADFGWTMWMIAAHACRAATC